MPDFDESDAPNEYRSRQAQNTNNSGLNAEISLSMGLMDVGYILCVHSAWLY